MSLVRGRDAHGVRHHDSLREATAAGLGDFHGHGGRGHAAEIGDGGDEDFGVVLRRFVRDAFEGEGAGDEEFRAVKPVAAIVGIRGA